MENRLTDQASPDIDGQGVEGLQAASHDRSAAITAASILFLIHASSPLIIPILIHVIRNRELPVVFGGNMVLLGGGFIEALGMDAAIASMFLFLALSVIEVLAGFWLWKSQKKGGILGLILLPLMLIIAIGWIDVALLIIIPIQGLLLILGWKSLR